MSQIKKKKADFFLKFAWTFFQTFAWNISTLRSGSFRINFKDTPSHISMDSYGVYVLSRMLLEFFLKPVFRTMVAEKFQIHSVTITGKCICESKNWICSFLFMSLSKNLPQVLIITTPCRRKLTISPKQCFLYFSPTEREEDYGAEKMTKIKLARILVTNFDKFCYFCNHCIFGFCSAVP